MHELLQSLSGGDRRSTGASARAAALAVERPELIAVLFRGIEIGDPVLRMRCADAVEKASAMHPEFLAPFKSKLLRQLCRIEQQEVRWHVAPMLARLPLSAREERLALDILLGYTNDRSSIVKTMAMQALADIALRNPSHLPEVRRNIEELTVIGTPAMKARGAKLLARIAKAPNGQPPSVAR